jgi:hypothetical protein
LALALIEQQRQTWPMLAAGYAGLARIEVRPLSVQRSEVLVQHNPGRIRNTTADVAAAAAGERPCFLCPESLPPEEMGIAVGEEWILLCNPFPILDRHLSIVHRDHVAQRLAGRVEALLALAEGLGPDFFVLYNGPRCGASAPDHLHFQACSRRVLPIEADAAGRRARVPGDVLESDEGVTVLTPEECGRSVIVLRARDRDRLRAWIESSLSTLPSDRGGEPMVNLVCTADEGGFAAYLFPRARHRPACFYATGPDRLVLSPGAIDMAGVFVVPEHADFERLDGARLAAILAEVTLPVELVLEVAEGIGA